MIITRIYWRKSLGWLRRSYSCTIKKRWRYCRGSRRACWLVVISKRRRLSIRWVFSLAHLVKELEIGIFVVDIYFFRQFFVILLQLLRSRPNLDDCKRFLNIFRPSSAFSGHQDLFESLWVPLSPLECLWVPSSLSESLWVDLLYSGHFLDSLDPYDHYRLTFPNCFPQTSMNFLSIFIAFSFLLQPMPSTIQLIDLLEHPTLSEAAVAAFDIISIECPHLHLPAVKHLFQQKLFQICLKGFCHKLETYSEHHVSAFVFVLKFTPHQVLKNNIQKVRFIYIVYFKNQNSILFYNPKIAWYSISIGHCSIYNDIEFENFKLK